MTQEDKNLLLKDLSARLPYGVHLFTNSKHHIRLLTISNDIDYNEQYWVNGLYDIDEVKPYLRPMSSITKEEKEELIKNFWGSHTAKDTFEELSWYLSKHLDVNGLIPKGLAIEVTEENNPYED